jgi:hypothetical protein
MNFNAIKITAANRPSKACRAPRASPHFTFTCYGETSFMAMPLASIKFAEKEYRPCALGITER